MSLHTVIGQKPSDADTSRVEFGVGADLVVRGSHTWFPTRVAPPIFYDRAIAKMLAVTRSGDLKVKTRGPISHRMFIDSAMRNALMHLSPADLMWDVARKTTPAHHTCSVGEHEALERLIAAGVDLEARDLMGRTPVHITCSSADRHKALAMLIAAGVNLDASDITGRTPTHLACGHYNHIALAMLIAAGVNLEAVDTEARTPTHLACRLDNHKALAMLIAADANLDAKDVLGYTPGTLAKDVRAVKCAVMAAAQRRANVTAHLPGPDGQHPGRMNLPPDAIREIMNWM